MNCIYLKQKVNRKLYCKKQNKEIRISECSNCKYREYKDKSNSHQIRKRTSKLVKLERNRFSLFTDDESKCMFCGSTHQLSWHEIFRGRNRANSMKFGLCLRIVPRLSRKTSEHMFFNEFWHTKGQALFEKTYPTLNFKDIFGKNYKYISC